MKCKDGRNDGKDIGFIGLGLMGGYMAMNLVKAGHKVHCYDLVAERLQPLQNAGAIVAANIEEVAIKADVSILSLPNLRAVREVTESMLQTVRPGHIILNTSTVTASLTKRLDAVCKENGVIYFDSPVSGGVKGAELGTLTFMVGGDQERYPQIKPILACMGKSIFYVGVSGTASIIKLINQLLFFAGVLNVCEAVYFADKAGVDKKTMFEIVATGSGNSYALQTRMQDYIVPGHYEPGCSVNLALKDVELLLAEATELGITFPIVALVEKRLSAAKELGIAEKDISLMASYYEKIVNYSQDSF